MGATRNTGYLENLIQYDASDNVAIATSVNASYKVTLGGSLLGTSARFTTGISAIGQEQAITFQRTTGTASDVYSFNADSGSAYLYNNTTAKPLMVWAEGGNVGIGTPLPAALIETYLATSTVGANTPATSGTTPNNALARFNNVRGQVLDIGSQYSNNYAIWLQVSDKGNLGVYYPLLLNPNGGNVGIGTTSPDVALHIVKTPNTNNDAVYNLILQDPTAFSSRIGAGVSFGGYYDSTNTTFTFANIKGFKENTTSGDYAGALAFSTRTNGGNPTERMRITSGGNVGIGYTSIATGVKLDVNGVIKAVNTKITSYSTTINANTTGNIDFNLNSILGTSGVPYGSGEIIVTMYINGGVEGNEIYKITFGGYLSPSFSQNLAWGLSGTQVTNASAITVNSLTLPSNGVIRLNVTNSGTEYINAMATVIFYDAR